MNRSACLITLITLVTAGLAGCQKRDPLYCPKNPDDPLCIGGDGGTADTPDGYVTIGGNVTGLNGASGLVLQNNGADDKLILSDGSFQFASGIPMGTAYNVTVANQPTNPSETCTVSGGTGTATSTVMDVVVTCAPAAYVIGGTVAGYTSGTLVLQNNGADDKTITMSGGFMFATKIPSGQPYDVTIKTMSGISCNVSGGTGTVGNSDVTSVVVVCGNNLFTVGGAPTAGGVSGLNGKVVLHNAISGATTGQDSLTLSANGSFAFPMPLPGGGTTNYNVTVATPPAYPPASQTCTIARGSGSVGNQNITNVGVTCTTNKFTVGGMVSGLTGGTLVLKDNGGDNLSITANGAFTFATPITSGLTYSVNVGTQPAGQTCSVTNKSGTIMNSDITNVAVTCVDTGIKCGGTYCRDGFQDCCLSSGGAQCVGGQQQCNGFRMPCDDAADCGSGNVCCAYRHNGNLALQGFGCTQTCNGDNIQLCNPLVANECAAGTCQPWNQVSGYYACQ